MYFTQFLTKEKKTVDEVGTDEMGVDEMGSRRSGNKSWKRLYYMYLCSAKTITLISCVFVYAFPKTVIHGDTMLKGYCFCMCFY